MADPPPVLSDPLTHGGLHGMDALSEVLRVIRLTGGVFLEASFTAPWSVTAHIGPEDCRPTMAQPARIVAFHYVLDGRMRLEVRGSAPFEVRAGAIVLLPHNDPHTLASGPGLPAVDADHLVQLAREGALARIDYGGGGAATNIVCGFVGSEARRHPLLDALPRVLNLDLNGRTGADWIAASFRFAAKEVAAARPGSSAVLAKLSELMFVEAVREYVHGMPAERQGWLAGLRDPAVGRALALLHARPAHPWTAEALAAEALLSRSAFADRFTGLVGVPPMSYLTAWRMHVAAQSLRESGRSIAQIAAAVGYESEATFARAFKREMGVAPGRYRSEA
ncbi:MAG: AraC family transcriptional regulator [Candidatus Competibacter sp.]|nr:AraC family transcriptional regulator [Candidatus Competibacter sp.]